MRRKKYLDERLDACGNVNLGWLVDYAAEQRGETQQRTLDVREIFGNDNPVHLEVGCGKGGFAVEAARRNGGDGKKRNSQRYGACGKGKSA